MESHAVFQSQKLMSHVKLTKSTFVLVSLKSWYSPFSVSIFCWYSNGSVNSRHCLRTLQAYLGLPLLATSDAMCLIGERCLFCSKTKYWLFETQSMYVSEITSLVVSLLYRTDLSCLRVVLFRISRFSHVLVSAFRRPLAFATTGESGKHPCATARNDFLALRML